MKGGAAKQIYHLHFYVEGRRLVVTDPKTAFMYRVYFNEGPAMGELMLKKIRRAIDGGRKKSGLTVKRRTEA